MAPGPRPEALIELGEDWSVPEPVADPEAPRRRRSGWLFVLALLPALALTVSARPPTPFREVATVPAASNQIFVVTAGTVAVVEAALGDSSRVTSYPLSGGPARWTANVPGPVGALVPQPGSRVLFAVSAPGFVAALDLDSGELLWSMPGAFLVDGRDGTGRAVVAVDRTPASRTVRALDVRTGRPLWSVSLPAPPAAAPWILVAGPDGTGPGRVAVLDGDTLSVLDEASGARLASTSAGIPSADERHDARVPRLYLLGGRAIVAYEANFHTVLSGYDLDPFALRWSASMPTETSSLSACGPVLCAGTGPLGTCFPVRCSAIDSYLFGLDPVTATLRWVSPTWSRTGPPLPTGTRPTVIVFNREPPGLTARAGIVDPRTGQVLLNLGSWAPVNPAPDTPAILAATEDDSYHSWFAMLRTGGTALVPVGRLPVAGQACQSAPAYLVCPTLDGRLTVWRYRPP